MILKNINFKNEINKLNIDINNIIYKIKKDFYNNIMKKTKKELINTIAKKNSYNKKMIVTVKKDMKKLNFDFIDSNYLISKDDINSKNIINIEVFQKTLTTVSAIMSVKITGSVVKKILGKAVIKAGVESASIPGEWFGPWGWAVESTLVGGSFIWDLKNFNTDKKNLIIKNTISFVNNFLNNIYNMQNENKMFSEYLITSLTNDFKLVRTKLLYKINNNWSKYVYKKYSLIKIINFILSFLGKNR